MNTVADAAALFAPDGERAPLEPGSRPEVRFCSLADGSRLAFASLGKGAPLVLIPGWLTHLEESWTHPSAASARARLSRENRFIWYDRLGCGLSDRGPFRFSLEQDVAQLRAVLDAAKVSRCCLVGYSLGGPVAAAFAARYPERVDRLVFCSTFARGNVVGSAGQINALRELVRADWQLGARTLASMLLPNASARELRWFSALQRHAAPAEIAEQLLDHMWQLDVRNLLAELHTPALVIHDRQDQAIPVTAAEEIAALLPRARLEILEGNAHGPFFRDTPCLIERTLAFVHGKPARSAMVTPGQGNRLTRREQEILRLIARGMSNKAISSTLGIAVSTVERHVTNLYGKLDVRGRTDAVMRAFRMGLIPPDTF